MLAVALLATPAAGPAQAQHTAAQTQPAQPASAELAENLARYQRIAEDLRVTIAQTEVMRRQIDNLQHIIDSRRSAVGRVAAATYRGHRVHPIYVLAEADSRDDALRRLLMVTGFAERQQQEIDALSLTQARYEATQRTLESLIAQQRNQQQTLTALRRKLQQP